MTRFGVALRLAVQVAVTVPLVPLAILATRRRWRLAGTLAVLVHRTFLRLFGVRVVSIGEPPAPAVPTLVLANHVSWLDIPVVGSLRPLSFVAKSEIAGWPVVGALARLQRTIFVDRSRKGATATTNAEMGGRLADGDAIVLFAEGTTGDGIRTLPFRSSLVGAVRTALGGPAGPATPAGDDVAAIRIQPLALVYTCRWGLPITRRDMPAVAWYGDMELGPHLGGFFRGGPLDIVAVWGRPIPTDARLDRKRATAAAEAAIRDAVQAVRSGRLLVRGGEPPVRAGRALAPYSLAGPAVVEGRGPGPGAARSRPA